MSLSHLSRGLLCTNPTPIILPWSSREVVRSVASGCLVSWDKGVKFKFFC